MPAYRGFGYVIQSDIELSELPLAPDGVLVDWRIRTAPRSFVGDLGIAIGSEPVYDGVHVRAFAAGDVRRLVFDDTGTFEIRPCDRLITWFPGASATIAAVRADILGRVIASAAHADGRFVLHASAVAMWGRAVALLGPKHAGKSTLAMALVHRGARLITDDTLVVHFDGRGTALAAPGVQQVRLWDDSARALNAATSRVAGAKPIVGGLTPADLMADDIPLVACYVLGVGDPGSSAPARRRRLSPPQAAIACVRFSKLGGLAGGVDAAAVLDHAAALARLVPVVSATVRRDLGALEQVAASFVAWHVDRNRAAR